MAKVDLPIPRDGDTLEEKLKNLTDAYYLMRRKMMYLLGGALDDENFNYISTNKLIAGEAKISTALIEDLVVGENITMGPYATLSWEQITGTDDIPFRSDLTWDNLIGVPTDLLTQSQLTAALTNYVTTGQMTDALANTLNLGNFSTIITRDYIASMNLIVGNEILMGANAHIGWLNVDNKPAFSSVATSGSYSDLSGKPNIEIIATNITADYLETPNLYTNIGTVYNLLRIGSPSSSSTQKSLYFNDSVNFTTYQNYIPGQYCLELSCREFRCNDGYIDFSGGLGIDFTGTPVTGLSVVAKFG